MAARGESRQDVELSRPQAAGRKVSVVRSTDFIAGEPGLQRGRRQPPLHVHRSGIPIKQKSHSERNPSTAAPKYFIPAGNSPLSISDSYDSLHFRQGILKKPDGEQMDKACQQLRRMKKQ